MTTQELTTSIFQRLRKVKVIVLTTALIAAMALIVYAKQKPITYTSTASVFPLTSGNDNNNASFIYFERLIGG